MELADLYQMVDRRLAAHERNMMEKIEKLEAVQQEMKADQQKINQTLYGVSGENGMVRRFFRLERSYNWYLALAFGAAVVIGWLIDKAFVFKIGG